MINFKSFKVVVFFLLVISIIIPLIILSFILTNSVNSQIDSALEKNVQDGVRRSVIIYKERENQILKTGHTLAKNPMFFQSVIEGDRDISKSILTMVSEMEGIDMASVTSPSGEVIVRMTGERRGDVLSVNGIVDKVVRNQISLASFEVVSEDILKREGLEFQARIRKIPTLYDVEDQDESVYERRGLMIVAAVPLISDGEVKATIVLGDLLNRDYSLPDEINRVSGLQATFFLQDTRVSTTVNTSRDERFIGTSLAEEVYEKTIGKGETFVGRTWAVHDWGRAVYLPLQNHKGEVIGVFGAGLFEDEFFQSRFFFRKEDFISMILLITSAVALLSLFLAYLVTKKITTPIYKLIESTVEVGEGNFEDEVDIDSYEEINRLAASFNHMIRSLREQMVEKEREILSEYAKRNEGDEDDEKKE